MSIRIAAGNDEVGQDGRNDFETPASPGMRGRPPALELNRTAQVDSQNKNQDNDYEPSDESDKSNAFCVVKKRYINKHCFFEGTGNSDEDLSSDGSSDDFIMDKV